ncbi:hypothetical protein ACFZDJ_01585 [Streptomyces sp. NPDC007896]|uniref:hypothetical protein n=1 Tax=Streptomyces sp. NPDC007896 TaxID=3364784 RepID=UPI0036E30F94
MSTYLNNALDGYARPDKETYRVRAGAFLLTLEGVRHVVRFKQDAGFPEEFTEDTRDDVRITHFGCVRSLVYDAFAFLAATQGETDRDRHNRLEELAYEVLLHANTENDTAMLEAADEMASLTPYWVKVSAA